MDSAKTKISELVLLFVALPLSYLLEYPMPVKVTITLLGFGYVLWSLWKSKLLKLSYPKGGITNRFWKETGLKLAIIIVVTSIYVYTMAPDKLYQVVLNKPLLWVVILFIYSFLSVLPQEYIYRTYFFERYKTLFLSPWVMILVNAVLFSLAHLFLGNMLVQVLTFLGGLLFAYTYTRTKSTLLVSIEHAIYGNWLFTVGMGEMLAFPS